MHACIHAANIHIKHTCMSVHTYIYIYIYTHTHNTVCMHIHIHHNTHRCRNLISRSLAIGPSLLVVILAGAEGANQLVVISSVVLAMHLPFALVPLLKFTDRSVYVLSKARKTYTCSCVRAYVRMYTYTYMCTIYMCVYICVCVYIIC